MMVPRAGARRPQAGRGAAVPTKASASCGDPTAPAHDPLTGLLTRVAFLERLRRTLVAQCGSPGEPVGVMTVGLDGFRPLNECFGLAAADEVLLETAARLQDAVGDDVTVGRVGSDEFGVVIEGADTAAMRAMARRVLGLVSEPITTSTVGTPLSVRASAGITVALRGSAVDEVMSQAGVALSAAKYEGGNRWEVYSAERHRSMAERGRTRIDVAGALSRDELTLHFQPIVELRSNRVVAVEALLRWVHPERGLRSPNEFVPLAEESGAIREIGLWALSAACRQTRLWNEQARGDLPLEVGVNVSPRQFRDGDFADRAIDAIRAEGLAPGLVNLEVTESALVEDADELIPQLEHLRRLGVSVSLDDFGTGYSSLSHLRRLPVDVLKIDRSFVAGITRSVEEWALATAVVRLARAMGKRTVAEGLEDPGQLAHVRALGCERAQGYLFARPLPADEVAPLLELPAEGSRQ